MTVETLEKVLDRLEEEYPLWNAPVVTFMADSSGTPFKVLVATLLSLRTKDETTHGAMLRLFEVATTPEQMLTLSKEEIEKRIYPVGFYHRKAENLLEVSRIIIEDFGGKVPDTIDELLTLPGVGRKTANLVVVLGFGGDGICVDTHVHRISNRWGFVETKTPEKTEFALREKLPLHRWRRYNDLIVAFGQTICKPISPLCDARCPVENLCPKIGVEKHR